MHFNIPPVRLSSLFKELFTNMNPIPSLLPHFPSTTLFKSFSWLNSTRWNRPFGFLIRFALEHHQDLVIFIQAAGGCTTPEVHSYVPHFCQCRGLNASLSVALLPKFNRGSAPPLHINTLNKGTYGQIPHRSMLKDRVCFLGTMSSQKDVISFDRTLESSYGWNF